MPSVGVILSKEAFIQVCVCECVCVCVFCEHIMQRALSGLTYSSPAQTGQGQQDSECQTVQRQSSVFCFSMEMENKPHTGTRVFIATVTIPQPPGLKEHTQQRLPPSPPLTQPCCVYSGRLHCGPPPPKPAPYPGGGSPVPPRQLFSTLRRAGVMLQFK